MQDLPAAERLIDMVAQSLLLADDLGPSDAAIRLDQALSSLDSSHHVLRESAERLWKLPDE